MAKHVYPMNNQGKKTGDGGVTKVGVIRTPNINSPLKNDVPLMPEKSGTHGANKTYRK